jgi:lysophospholipase
MLPSRPEGFPGLPASFDSQWVSCAVPGGSALSLFVSRFVKQGPLVRPRVLFVLHGQGEHGGRYQHFPAFLEDSIDAVICMDHRGHGRSPGVRGHVDRFDQYVNDAAAVLQATLASFESPRVHLFGHSMGGLILLLLLQEKLEWPLLASATFSAPLLELKHSVPALKQLSAHLLSRVLGGLQLETGLDARLISHDEAVVRAYQSDQLVHSKATVRFFTEMVEASKRARKLNSGIRLPTFWIVPMQDQVVSAAETLRFYEDLKSPDKKLVKYEGFFHESFNEIDKLRAFGDLSQWIREHP